MAVTRFEPKPVKNKIIALLVVGLLIFGITKLFPDTPPAFLKKTLNKAESKESAASNKIKNLNELSANPIVLNNSFEVSEVKITSDNSWPHITGTVKNISNKNYKDVSLKIDTYNSKNKYLQSHYDDAFFLESGQSWKFDVLILDEGTTTYKIAEIQASDITGKDTSTPGLKIVSSRLISEGSTQYITGIIENTSKKHFDEASVTLSIMDKNGILVKSSIPDILCFEPRQKWKFKEDIYDLTAGSYKIMEVKGSEDSNTEHFAPGLKVINSNLSANEYSKNIKGIVKNNSSSYYSFVSLTINVFDKDGYVLESLIENRSGLFPNGSWKFDLDTFVKDIESFKVVEIRANK